MARAPRARRAARVGARGARARLLERSLAERGRGLPEHPARDGEDEDAERPVAARGTARGRAAMTRPPDFDELVGPDAEAGERERLRRLHDLLVAAGPPPDLA